MSNGLDELIKSRLGDAAPEVPSRVWENIVAARKKKKPIAFWWNAAQLRTIAAGVALVGCTAITWVLIHHHSAIDNNTTVVSGTSTIQSSSTSTDQNKQPINPAAGNDVTTNQTNYTSNNNIPVVPGQNANSVTGNNKNITALTADNNSGRHSRKNSLKASYTKSRIHYKSDTEDANAIDNTANQSNDDNIVSSLTTINAIPFNDQLSSLTVKIKKADRLKATKLLLPECPTVEKAPSRKRDYIEVYISPDMGIRSTSDAADPAYLNSRNATSGFTSAFSAGVTYTKVFGNGLSLREGLNYSRINEFFGIDTIINISTGDSTFSRRATRNHYSSLDIPITIGYEFPFSGNSRFIANINGGVIVNIFSWQNGSVIDTTGKNNVQITTNQSPYTAYSFKTAMGLGLIADLSVFYKLNDQVALVAEPYIRYNIQPMTQNVSSFTERYTTIGLHLGMRFDLQ